MSIPEGNIFDGHVLYQVNTLSGPSTSQLILIPQSSRTDGQMVWVENPGKFYVYRASATDTPDGIFIVAPLDGIGRWFSIDTSIGPMASRFTEITADTTTNSTVFVSFLSTTINLPTPAQLIVHFTFSASVDVGSATVDFRLSVDGVGARGCASRFPGGNQPHSGALVWRSGVLAAGNRVVAAEWKSSVVTTTVRIRPVTVPDQEHASLLIYQSAAV